MVKEGIALIDMNVGPAGFIVGPPTRAFLRNYDSAADELTFWEDRICLALLIAELLRIETAVLNRGVATVKAIER